MTQEQDPFYQKLPFTLQENQLNPAFVILGTGLQESLLAAYFSKMEEKMGLIMDIEKTYGSCLKTVTLKEFHQLSTLKLKQKLYEFFIDKSTQEKNEQFFQKCMEKNAFRGYNIDIEPCLFLGNSITCECLKQADMDKYMDFRLINHMLVYENGKLSEVPLSKGKIFESKSLGLSEKKLLLTSLHTFIKIYHRFSGIEEDQNSTNEFNKGFGQVSEDLYSQFTEQLEKPFLPFVTSITKGNRKITDYLVYIICNYQYNYNKEVPDFKKEQYTLKAFIQRFGKFITSCGIYGESPYLYVDNGMGDIPQAFSRIASIFGSTYVLHPKLQISSIKTKQKNIQTSQPDKEESPSQIQQSAKQQPSFCVEIQSNIAPEKTLISQNIYYGPTFAGFAEQLNSGNHNQFGTCHQKVFLLLVLSEQLGSEEECPSLGYFLNLESSKVKFQNPVYLFIFDDSTHTCPQNFMVYQFETVIDQSQVNSQNLRLMSEDLIERLCEVRGKETFKNSIKYVSSYVRTRNYSAKRQSNGIKSNQISLQDTSGLDLDVHFENFIEIVGKKDNYFKKKSPHQWDNDCDEEQGFGSYTNNILERLQNIDVHEPSSNTKKKTQSQEKVFQSQVTPEDNKEEMQPKITSETKQKSTDNYQGEQSKIQSTNVQKDGNREEQQSSQSKEKPQTEVPEPENQTN